MKTTVSVRLHNVGSPYAMFAYNALKGNTGQKSGKMRYYMNSILKRTSGKNL